MSFVIEAKRNGTFLRGEAVVMGLSEANEVKKWLRPINGVEVTVTPSTRRQTHSTPWAAFRSLVNRL